MNYEGPNLGMLFITTASRKDPDKNDEFCIIENDEFCVILDDELCILKCCSRRLYVGVRGLPEPKYVRE